MNNDEDFFWLEMVCHACLQCNKHTLTFAHAVIFYTKFRFVNWSQQVTTITECSFLQAKTKGNHRSNVTLNEPLIQNQPIFFASLSNMAENFKSHHKSKWGQKGNLEYPQCARRLSHWAKCIVAEMGFVTLTRLCPWRNPVMKVNGVC